MECSIAPEISVEILSSSNTDDEMRDKREIYFEAGSQEVWICSAEGNMSCYNPQGQLEQSILVPKFPAKISI